MRKLIPAAAAAGMAVWSMTAVPMPSAIPRLAHARQPVFIGDEKTVPGGANGLSEGISPEIFRQLEPLEIETHVVQKGETLAQIAARYGTDVDTLRGINRLDYPSVAPGKKLVVINKKGYLYRVRPRETMELISKRFGVGGEKIREANRIGPLAEPVVGQALYLPGVRVRFNRYIAPVHGSISSRFGMRLHPLLGIRRFHEGVDLRQQRGAPVFSAREGRVRFAGRRGGYGKMVEVVHADGYETRYGHLSKISVRAGQKVRQGQMLGRVGSTGLSTGPHLHFEMRRFGSVINPMRFLRGVL